MKAFSKKMMQEIAYDDYSEANLIEDNIVEVSRWSIIHEIIFEYKEKFYKSSYSKGATEMQDESPYEYDEDMINCTEVEQKEIMVKQWVEVKNEN